MGGKQVLHFIFVAPFPGTRRCQCPKQVDDNAPARRPEGGSLQDRRTAQAPVREQDAPLVALAAACHDRIQGNACQIADRLLIVCLQRERYEPRFRRDDLEPELFRDAVSISDA
jgi:hypothetical protein